MRHPLRLVRAMRDQHGTAVVPAPLRSSRVCFARASAPVRRVDEPPAKEARALLSRDEGDDDLDEADRLRCRSCDATGAGEAPASRLGDALGASEWSEDELSAMLATLSGLAEDAPPVDVRASSGRQRRLVHFAAASLGLHHETLTASANDGHAVRVRRIAPSSG